MTEDEKIRLLREQIRDLFFHVVIDLVCCSFCHRELPLQLLSKATPGFMCDYCLRLFRSKGDEPGRFVRIH